MQVEAVRLLDRSGFCRQWPRLCSELDDSFRDELNKNRSSRKIDSQRLFSREYDFPKTFSLTENQCSGKTYFYTIGSRLFEDGERSEAKQAFHTEKVVGLLEEEMKDCLVGLAQYLFGKGIHLLCIRIGDSIVTKWGFAHVF